MVKPFHYLLEIQNNSIQKTILQETILQPCIQTPQNPTRFLFNRKVAGILTAQQEVIAVGS